MAIVFTCRHCGQQLSVPEHGAGRKVRCPGCKSTVKVPAPGAPAAPAPAGAKPEAAAPQAVAPQAPAPPAADAASQFLTCPGCGNEIRRDAGACFFCGRPIGEAPRAAPPAAAPPPEPKAPAGVTAPVTPKPSARPPEAKPTPAAAPVARPAARQPAPSPPEVAAPAAEKPSPRAPRAAERAKVEVVTPAPAVTPPATVPAPPAAEPGPAPLQMPPLGAADRLARTMRAANLMATIWLGVVVLAGLGAAAGGFLMAKIAGLAIGLGAAVVAAALATLQWFLVRTLTGALDFLLDRERHAEGTAEADRLGRSTEELSRMAAIETQTHRLTTLGDHLAEIARRVAFLPLVKKISDQLDQLAQRPPAEEPRPTDLRPEDPEERREGSA